MAGEVRFDGLPAGLGDKSKLTMPGQWMHRQAGRLVLDIRHWGGRGRVSVYQDDGLVVVADSRLYSRSPLLDASGRAAPGPSDAAWIAQGYRQWGEDLPLRLDGDFAFVLVDLGRERVLAATDPVGVRPLFYRHQPGRSFAFSSSEADLADQLGLDARMAESRVLYPLVWIEGLWHYHPGAEVV